MEKTAKEAKSKKNTKWYKKEIHIITDKHFNLFVSLLFSICFYAIYLLSDAQEAKFISIFFFFISTGEIMGENIIKKYNIKNSYIFLFLLLFFLVSFILGGIIINYYILTVLGGFILGILIGFESRKLKKIESSRVSEFYKK